MQEVPINIVDIITIWQALDALDASNKNNVRLFNNLHPLGKYFFPLKGPGAEEE
jgi:hypothetical protein